MGKLSGLSKAVKKANKLGGTTAERMARAKAMGFKGDYYHGSTHDIDAFGGTTGNPEGHFGSSNYMTTSADDAGRHYAGEGPDLTSRIQRRAEQIAGELDLDYNDPTAYAAAKKELKGSHDGAIYPLTTRTDKTFDISSGGDNTFLSYEQPMGAYKDYLDEAATRVYESDYDDADDYAEALKEAAEDIALEDSYNFDPEGELVDFIDSLRWNNSIDESGKDELIGRIQEAAQDGGISGSDLDEIMRGTEWYAEGDTGGMINNEVYRQAIEDAGFDSIVHDADIFNGMDVEPGTKHKIVFDPSRIRSVNADFNPDLKDSANLMAGVGGAAVLGGAAMAPQDADAAIMEGVAMQGLAADWTNRRADKRSKWTKFKEKYAEPAMTVGSALASMPVQGLAGVGALAQGYGIDDAVGAMERTAEAMTYTPKSEAGMESLQNVGEAMEILSDTPPVRFFEDHINQGADWAADNIHPAAGTFLKTLPEVVF